MNVGLESPKPSKDVMPMIPTYVTSIPTGKEVGLYLAADLGGTNFRVCSIDLKGDHTFSMKQSKYRIPVDLMKAEKSNDLFGFWQRKSNLSYLKTIRKPVLQKHRAPQVGFHFLFPC